MTTIELPDFGVHGKRRALTVRGRWSLAAVGGCVEVRPRGRVWAPRAGRRLVGTFPLLSGALVIGDPVHLTVGEIAVAVDKTRSVRLTVGEMTALGNRRIAVDSIVSALGEDAGPDEFLRLEGHFDLGRAGSLSIVLGGPAPASLGGPNMRIRLSATFGR